ncbi:MAG TPA: long-chain fatty acid--CoA ligase [Actinomycetota bacterium]|nr:long-chain fatty acid--CoA ligase [Actinomycetota bacterium]
MAETIIELFWERTRTTPDKVALRYKSGGTWQDITWREYGRQVRRAGKGLLSLGFRHGDKMSLLSKNRPAWHVADIACLSVGGATAPVYTTNSPEQVQYIVDHSDSKVAVVEDMEQLEKILKMRAELPKLEKVVVIEGYDGTADADLVMSWDDFLSAGDSEDDFAFDEAVGQVQPSDLATFVYTSGTTGPPKAVMLTHNNIWWTASSAIKLIAPPDYENARTISYLPLSHIAERMISHFLQIFYGSQTWFAESLDTLLEDLKDVRPTYFFAVPRVWEKFHAGLMAKMAAADPDDRKVKMARKAIEVGRQVAELEQEAVARGGKMADARVPVGLKLKHALLDKVVLHKIRDAFGLDQCELPLSAAAPLNPELIWFFHAIGIKIAEGYGQSEDTGPTTWNPPDAIRIGSVGIAMPGLELRIAEDGEILARGGNVSPGYYKNEQATSELIDADGWMHSGDVGELDEHGYLKITDRKKDLIITAGGKNIAPQELENRIKVHSLISQAVVIGDQRPFLTALVTLDEEKAPGWAQQHGIEGGMAEIAGHERTLKELEVWFDELNAKLAKVEGIKKFRVLERDFLQEENEITPTLKVKRKQINEIYGDAIEDMYRKDSPTAASVKAPVRT